MDLGIDLSLGSTSDNNLFNHLYEFQNTRNTHKFTQFKMPVGLINVINRLPKVSHLFQLKAKHNELLHTWGWVAYDEEEGHEFWCNA
jgi:hypothetical protein